MIDGKKAVRSFRFAWQGVWYLFRHENNAKIHAVAALGVLGFGVWLGLSRIEWAILLTQIGLVWAAEAFNTALEKLCDHITPHRHEAIKHIKDLSAAAVLILSLTAVGSGLLILGGRLLEVLHV